MKHHKGEIRTTLHDGYADGFVPLKAIDLKQIKTFSDMAKAMSFTALTARQIGEATDTLHEMAKNKDCFVVLTLSGIMTVAKMSLIICDLIEAGVIDAIVSTGALITHGFVEGSGKEHFKYQFGQMDDTQLYYKGYDRIYDCLELEQNLDDAEKVVDKVLESLDSSKPVCSHMILQKLGEHLSKNMPGRGIIKSAYEHKVPIFIPAFTDSELGLDVGLFNRRLKLQGKKPLQYDPYLDLEYFTKICMEQKELGIFTIGGGVPRNWAQQVACYLDLINKRNKEKVPILRYKYGVRICPEPVHWGGLSGCTYSEGVSWGKFIPSEEGGRHIEVLSEATAVLPLIAKALMERLGK